MTNYVCISKTYYFISFQAYISSIPLNDNIQLNAYLNVLLFTDSLHYFFLIFFFSMLNFLFKRFHKFFITRQYLLSISLFLNATKYFALSSEWRHNYWEKKSEKFIHIRKRM